jgi:hypothetical protein
MSFDEFFGEQNAFDFAAPNPAQVLRQKVQAYYAKQNLRSKKKGGDTAEKIKILPSDSLSKGLVLKENSKIKALLEQKILKTLAVTQSIQNEISIFRSKDVPGFKKWKKLNFKKIENDSQTLHSQLESLHDEIFKLRSRGSGQNNPLEFLQDFQFKEPKADIGSQDLEDIKIWAEKKSKLLAEIISELHSSAPNLDEPSTEKLLSYLEKEGCLGIPFHFDPILGLCELHKVLDSQLGSTQHSQATTPNQVAQILFKKLAVRLHPDRNPKYSHFHKQLWTELQEKKGDYSALQIIESKYLLIIAKKGQEIPESLLNEVFLNEKEKLSALKKEFAIIQNQIEFGFSKLNSTGKTQLKKKICAKFASEKKELKVLIKTAAQDLKVLRQRDLS